MNMYPSPSDSHHKDRSCVFLVNRVNSQNTLSTEPANPDTDGDMLVDGAQADFDNVSWKYVKKYRGIYEELNDTWSDYGKIWGEMAAETGTNPHLFDTDHDGIADGYELQNLSMLGIPQGDWAAILHARDYDDDGMPDGYEIRMAYWANTTNKSAWNAGKYLNVTNSTDAYLDFDSDGLTNLEEYRRDPQGNFDDDLTPDIYDTDDDNDGIPTSVELQYHLDPYNAADANGDLDHDGLSNLFEFNNGLNIQDADTDHDGIDDGEELNYWNVTRGLDMDTAISYCKNPDVDGDNITDGKEINGYEVKIITGWKSDGTPISELRYISPTELDPLVPYANSTGVWTDTDHDGIPDVVEAMLSNTSYWRFLVVEYPLLWAQYSWAAKYYDTIKNKENESAAEQWLHDQFNPLIVDHTPPVVTKFTLRWEARTTTSPPFVAVYAVVHVAVRDVGGIYSLNIYDLDSGEEYEPNKLGYTHYDLEHKFSASLLQAGVGSVTIRVYAEDYAGNSIQVQKNLSGAFGVVLNVLSELWSQFWATLVAVGKAIVKAVNFIVQWVVRQIQNLFGPVLDGIESKVKTWFDTLIRLSNDMIEAYNTGRSPRNTNIRSLALSFLEVLFGPIFIALATLFTSLTLLVIFLGPLLGTIASAITAVVTSLILLAFIGTENIEYSPLSLDIFSRLSLNNVVDSTRNYLKDQGVTDDSDSAIWEILSIAFSMMSLALTAQVYELLEAPLLSYFALGISIAMTILAIIVEGFIYNNVQSYSERKAALRMLAFTEDICTILGLLVDLPSLRKIGSTPQISLLIGLSLIFKFIGLGFSLGVLATLN